MDAATQKIIEDMNLKVPTNDDEAEEVINELTSKAYDVIAVAERIAILFGISFSFEVAEGSGANFNPDEEAWESSNYY